MLVCLAPTHLLWNTALGGHAWVFLNWVAGLRDAGARAVVFGKMRHANDPERLFDGLRKFHDSMATLGLEVDVALTETPEQREKLDPVRAELEQLTMPCDQVYAEAELLLNFRYEVKQDVLDRFRRTALIDIDPGLLQMWISGDHLAPSRHDLNFTIGETVGQPQSRFSDCGMDWVFSPPPVHLPSWPVTETPEGASYTTVTNWWGEFELINGQSVNNEKRTNFIAYIDLPRMTSARLELAIYHEEGNPSDMPLMQQKGWRARPASEVSTTAQDYRSYIQQSRGEFSCAKESCMVFANAWISDRTICYLASGKPAVVQHTGKSCFLPDAEGLFRFETMQEAARFLDHLERPDNYAAHSQAARAIAEEYFDAGKVMRDLLGRAMELKPRGER